jgi:hypothetical protein
MMKRHAAVVILTTDGGGCCIDEELDNIECHIWILQCNVKGQPPIISSRTGSDRKVFDQTLDYSLIDSLIAACSMEEFIEAKMKRRHFY